MVVGCGIPGEMSIILSHNELSSSLPLAISYSGDTKIPTYDISLEYHKEKCCKIYVWKGPKYNDYGGI